MKKKKLSIMLAAIMAVCMLPTATFASSEDAGLQTGTPAFTINSSTVAFGGYEWWVIGDGTSGVNPVSGTITLLTKTCIEAVFFRTVESDNSENAAQYPAGTGNYYTNNPSGMDAWTAPTEYAGSTLQQKMQQLAESLGDNEEALITARDLTTADGILNHGISGQKYWALSRDEWGTINNTTVTANSLWWWLRSSSTNTFANCVNGSGELTYAVTAATAHYARPAFNLNLSNVLFTSEAGQDGKSSATAGGGFSPVTAPTGTVKFTMEEASRNGFAANGTAVSGNTLTISYTGAKVGRNEYVSAVIKRTDPDTDVTILTHYAKLVKPDSTFGTATLTLPDDFDANTDTIYVFSEQANGDLYTDFASKLRLVSLSVVRSIAGIAKTATVGLVDTYTVTYTDGTTSTFTVTNGTGGADGQNGADGKEIELQADTTSGYIKWRYVGETSWQNLIALSAITSTGGADGRDGAAGQNGIGIRSVTIGANEDLIVTLTDGSTQNAGKLAGADGTDGADGSDGTGIAAVKINDAGDLIFTLTDGSELNAGNVREAVTVMSNETPAYEGLILPGFIIALLGLLGNLGWIIPLVKKRRM